MRNWIIVASFLVFSVPSFSLTVGTIDIQKILFTSVKGKEIRKKLETNFNKKKAELKKQENKLKSRKKEFDKKAQLLSDKVRQNKQDSLQKMLIALETTRQKYQQEIREMEAGLTEPIVKSIYKLVEEVAKKRKFDLVFEVSASPLAYAANKKDLSDEVIKLFDKKHLGK